LNDFKPYHIYPVSMAIRAYLKGKGEGSAGDFYKDYKSFKPSTSYNSITRYFWMLKEMGLIVSVRKEVSKAPIPKTIYKIVSDLINDPRWKSPQKALWPHHFRSGRSKT